MEKLKKFFKNYQVPTTLKDLYAFEKECHCKYAQSFHMIPEDSMSEWISEYCYPEGNRFGERLIEFAQGGESLSSYALWLHAEDCDLEHTPVVFMESGSGVNLVAKDLKDFLRILSYDEDCGGDYYHKECTDYEMSEGHEQFIGWLKNFGVEPVRGCNDDGKDLGYDDVKKIINEAKALYGDQLNKWLYTVDNPNSELPFENLDTRGIDAQKMTITAIAQCVDLLSLPMNDTRLLGALDALNTPRPVLDTNFLKDNEIYLESGDKSIYLSLRKEDEDSLPVLDFIGFKKNVSLIPPFGIQFDDTYEAIKNKIGKKADFQHDISDEIKIWVLENENKESYELTIDFYEDDPYRDVHMIGLSGISDESNKEENAD